MRWIASIILAVAAFATVAGFTVTSAEAQRYRVACAVQGTHCRTACGSNTHAVVCWARIQNGRCVRYCGPPR